MPEACDLGDGRVKGLCGLRESGAKLNGQAGSRLREAERPSNTQRLTLVSPDVNDRNVQPSEVLPSELEVLLGLHLESDPPEAWRLRLVQGNTVVMRVASQKCSVTEG